MTMNLDNRPPDARQRRARIKQAVLLPFGVLRANRVMAGDRLLINGNPASWTSIDRTHSNRHQGKVGTAEDALNLARAEQAKPYSLAGEVARIIGDRIEAAVGLLG